MAQEAAFLPSPVALAPAHNVPEVRRPCCERRLEALFVGAGLVDRCQGWANGRSSRAGGGRKGRQRTEITTREAMRFCENRLGNLKTAGVPLWLQKYPR